jgi:hypothetical protein
MGAAGLSPGGAATGTAALGWQSTSPTNRMPLRAMVRISFAPRRRPPCGGVDAAGKGRDPPRPAAPDRGEKIVLADDALAIFNR